MSIRTNGRIAILVILSVLAVISTSAKLLSGGSMQDKVENALSQDSKAIRQILTLHDELGSDEPQTQEELDRWVANAQRVSAEIEQLKAQSLRLRTETIERLKSEDPSPLATRTIEFFEAENAYFGLADEPRETFVSVSVAGKLSDEHRRQIEAVRKHGTALLESFTVLIDAQDRLIEETRSAGIQYVPPWDLERQRELIETYKAARRFGEDF